MSHKRRLLKKYFKEILISVALIAFLVAALLIDVYIKVQLDVEFNIACNISLTVLTIVFTVWFSYLLVMKQIYQNKHEKDNVKLYINRGRGVIVSNFIILFIAGITISILGDEYMIANIVYCVLCFAYLIMCSLNIYFKVDKSELSNSISDNIDSIINQINSNSINETEKALTKLNEIYDRCFYKNDATSCKDIIQAYTDFLKKHIGTINEKIISGEGKSAKKYSSLLTDSLARLFKNDSSELAISSNQQIITNIRSIAIVAIDCDAISIFKKH